MEKNPQTGIHHYLAPLETDKNSLDNELLELVSDLMGQHREIQAQYLDLAERYLELDSAYEQLATEYEEISLPKRRHQEQVEAYHEDIFQRRVRRKPVSNNRRVLTRKEYALCVREMAARTRKDQTAKGQKISNKEVYGKLAEMTGESAENIANIIKRISKEFRIEDPLKRWNQKTNPRLR